MNRTRRKDLGAIAVLGSIVLLVVGGFMALALNVGLIMNTRGQLQNASDSAALAAAGSLAGTAAGIVAARNQALEFSKVHKVTGELVKINEYSDDVTFGRWHFDGSLPWFEELTPGATDPLIGGPNYLRLTAVRVKNGRDGGNHNDPLDTHFGAFLLTDRKTEVPSMAIAVGATARADCPIPFGVAACKIVNTASGEFDCTAGVTRTLTFANANNDAVGFINVTGSNDKPSNNWVEGAILNRSCDGSQVFNAGDAAPMQDGNDMNDKIINALMGRDNKGDIIGPCLLYTNNPAQPEVSVAITNNTGCPTDPVFNQSQEVLGFAKARIIEVCDNLGKAAQCDPGVTTSPCLHPGTSGPQRSVTFELVCGSGGAGGGGNGRVLRLVK